MIIDIMRKLIFKLRKIEWEGVMWLIGLAYLFFINPYEAQKFTLCPFHNLGIEFCPGCGLGRSISFIYHFDFINSFHTHPLGIIALVLIINRIIILFKRTNNNINKKENLWRTSTN